MILADLSINIDTFLKIGNNHKICEDYILSGTNPTPYIILSDGCSSSENTEMGARLLCYMARQFMFLKDFKCSTYDSMGDWIIINAEMVARQLGLNPSSLDATLIISYYDAGANGFITRFYGDGYIVTISKKDEIIVNEEKFDQNAPYYLSYRIDADRDHNYYQRKIDRASTSLNLTTGEEISGSCAYDYENVYHIDPKNYKLIMVCSDGLGSFYNKKIMNYAPININDVVTSFTSFKNATGEFLQRRVGKAIQQYEKTKIVHYDDIAIGAFLIEDLSQCDTM